MKKFENPKLSVVELPEEDVISTSPVICPSQICHGFDCPDCPTICTGIYHCNTFKCTTYEG